MSADDVIEKIQWYNHNNPWDPSFEGFLTDVSSQHQDRIKQAITLLFNSAPSEARPILEAGATTGAIYIGHSLIYLPAVAGEIPGTTTSFMGFDVGAIDRAYYINNKGVLIQERLELTVIHEFGHAYADLGDAPSDPALQNGAAFDFTGPATDKQNEVAEELGYLNNIQVSEFAVLLDDDPRFNSLLIGQSFSIGESIDIARFGDLASGPPTNNPPGTPTNDNLDLSARGDASRDLMFGFAGQDTIKGGGGADFLYGGLEGDSLSGGDDRDVLYGNEGDDSLEGGKGGDLLHGGDHRVYAGSRVSLDADGADKVDYSLNSDFEASGVKITVVGSYDTVHGDQTFAPGTSATDPADFLTALFVKDLGADGATDTLISVETITATIAADTLAVRTLMANKFAGADSAGGARKMTATLPGFPSFVMRATRESGT